MAFFNFRLPGMKGRDDRAPASAQPDSVEVMRKRARHRLIGAAVLVLVGVVGFPLLFDTQPRPVAVDIPITIPDRNKVAPLGSATGASSTQGASGTVTSSAVASAPAPTRMADTAGLVDGEEVVPSAKPERKPNPAPATPAQVATKTEAKPDPKPKAKPEEPASKTAAHGDDAARAKALLDGKSADADAAGVRIVVQVGAFADADKAREARLKLERAGLKTYTHVAETKEGKRTRVRVGPFATRAEADRAAQKIKKLDLPASILTL